MLMFVTLMNMTNSMGQGGFPWHAIVTTWSTQTENGLGMIRFADGSRRHVLALLQVLIWRIATGRPKRPLAVQHAKSACMRPFSASKYGRHLSLMRIQQQAPAQRPEFLSIFRLVSLIWRTLRQHMIRARVCDFGTSLPLQRSKNDGTCVMCSGTRCQDGRQGTS